MAAKRVNTGLGTTGKDTGEQKPTAHISGLCIKDQKLYEEKIERSWTSLFEKEKAEGDMVHVYNDMEVVYNIKAKLLQPKSCNTGTKGFLTAGLRSTTQQAVNVWRLASVRF